jgi:molybdopterin/thiamine biosynthesis adenylyltransferase
MNDAQLLRYSRHILLDDIGIDGQERLLASHALIIGAGGLGSPAALYLGSAGVGRVTVVDHDRVEATNLQRQIAHTTARIGQFKTQSIAEAIAQINPDVQVTALTQRADDTLLNGLVQQADVVLDCTDNFQTRHAINRACVQFGKPLVSGAARCQFLTYANPLPPATPACFLKHMRPKKPTAPPWAFSLLLWASLAACKRQRL